MLPIEAIIGRYADGLLGYCASLVNGFYRSVKNLSAGCRLGAVPAPENGMTKLLRGGIVVNFDNRPTALRLHRDSQRTSL
jgi:hypothetical protein